MSISLADYDFELPQERIAQHPASPRDSARLLVFNRADGSITDAVFRDIDNFLPQNTTIVVNNTKVDKCRLRFGNVEIFVLESVNDKTVRALVRPGPKFKLGREVELDDRISAEVTMVDSDGIHTLILSCALDDPQLEKFKLTPLPPYIAQNESLAEEYQTVYAKQEGSRAAPTAGLHFTPELLEKLRSYHTIAEITLEVGLGTFAPLRKENIESKHLHAERYSISEKTVAELNAANHITAVGTTTVRTLESAIDESRVSGLHTRTDNTGYFRESHGSTEIFIQPGYQFKSVDAMITNFHLPKTSLLMLVAAFMGYENMMECYRHAIKNKYRFYSFGDAMLIL